MAHLKTLATTRNLVERAEWKWILTQKLYERGLADGDIIKIFDIIDTMMTLPKPLQAELALKIKHLEESRKMPLVSPTIQLAREEGREEGKLIGEQRGELKGEQKVIIRQLNRRIGELKPSVIEQICKLPVEQLEQLAEELLDFSTVANLEQWLNSRPKPVES